MYADGHYTAILRDPEAPMLAWHLDSKHPSATDRMDADGFLSLALYCQSRSTEQTAMLRIGTDPENFHPHSTAN